MKRILLLLGIFLFGMGLILMSDLVNDPIAGMLAEAMGRHTGSRWPYYLRLAGFGGVVLGVGLVFGDRLLGAWKQVINFIQEKQNRLDDKIKLRFQGNLEFGEMPLELPRINRVDGIIILVFIVFSVFYQAARLSIGYPNVLLTSDAANLAGFAAARQYPELFHHDLILNNPDNFRLYTTIHIPLLRWMDRMLGNFGLAFSLLLGPHVFLQLFGFYWFGRILLHSRFWGLILSVMCAAPVPLSLGEVWGIVRDALPRFTFQVVLVFLLGLVLLWRSRPGRWTWIMIAAGLMAFIHPVSTPVWGTALLAGFWPLMPDKWSLRRRFGQIVLLGLVFIAALLPYLIIYLGSHQGGTSTTDYSLLFTIITKYFPENIYNMPVALSVFFSILSQSGLIWLGLTGMALSFLLLPGERRNLALIIFWMAGITIAAIILPWGEQLVEKRFQIIPLQTELVRGIRFFVPLLILLWVYPLAGLAGHLRNRWGVRVLMTLAVLSAATWLWHNPFQPTSEMQNAVACLARGRLVCPARQEYAVTLEAANSLTPPGSTFLVIRKNWNNGTELRYLALRPLVYSFKDKGFLVYSNHQALRHWYELFLMEKEVYKKGMSENKQKILAFDFARKSGTDYLLTDFPLTPEDLDHAHTTLIYRNGDFMILKLQP